MTAATRHRLDNRQQCLHTTVAVTLFLRSMENSYTNRIRHWGSPGVKVLDLISY